MVIEAQLAGIAYRINIRRFLLLLLAVSNL